MDNKELEVIKGKILSPPSKDRVLTQVGQASNEQIDTVNWFFTKMAMIWGKQYLVTFPDDNILKLTKVEWTENIVRYSNTGQGAQYFFHGQNKRNKT